MPGVRRTLAAGAPSSGCWAHIHWHVIPRRPDDPAPRSPVWTVNHAPKRIGAEELTARITSLQRRLGIG